MVQWKRVGNNSTNYEPGQVGNKVYRLVPAIDINEDKSNISRTVYVAEKRLLQVCHCIMTRLLKITNKAKIQIAIQC